MPRGPRTRTRTDTAQQQAPAPPGPSGWPASPAATRVTRSRWRDPRLAVGVGIVAVCTLVGARLLGGATDTVEVWAARGTLVAGQPLQAGDVTVREVRFLDRASADRYLPVQDRLPDGVTLGRAVGAGELLPRAALAAGPTGSLTELPLSVPAEAVPATVRVGSLVDVWVTPDRSATSAGRARDGSGPRSTRVLRDVRVVAAPRAGDALGPTATRQVIVGVGTEEEPALPTTIASLAGGTVLITVRR